jgi:hypothetical protein
VADYKNQPLMSEVKKNRGKEDHKIFIEHVIKDVK